MIIPVSLGEMSYDIVLLRGALNNLNEYLNLNRRVLIITDSGVPAEYAQAVLAQCKDGYTVSIEQGEASKSFDNYRALLSVLVKKGFTRTDCVVAVGGGVCGDLAGFVASSFMRGIDFYNIPTTFLSQVDSSIGGKVAIDFMGVKNIVGAFYQPKCVVIDPNVLRTLDKRQLSSGIAESIKMAATFDKDLFELLENTDDFEGDADKIIESSLKIKRDVVEKDPKEKGLRRVLNFGHTVGHAIESNTNLGDLLHGECVGLGMIPMSSPEVAKRIVKVLKKYNLPVSVQADSSDLISYILHDKKMDGDEINVVLCNSIGSFEVKKIKAQSMKEYIDGGIIK
ncbi:MAG: 3-dehydroquinate synthase [Clostridia bacterium]|nr:3-dehydroquinate synthase [Clostridia bacterium]